MTTITSRASGDAKKDHLQRQHTSQLAVRSFLWKGSSSGYLFLRSFGHLLLSDVVWLVVEEEVKRLLTLVQPVSNLVMMLLLCVGGLPIFLVKTFVEPFSRPLKSGLARPIDGWLTNGQTHRILTNRQGRARNRLQRRYAQMTDPRGQPRDRRSRLWWLIHCQD